MGREKIDGTVEAWESGKLGEDENHVKVSPLGIDNEIDQSLGLQSISIRLQKSLIEDFKLIARYHRGMGYQTLMRQILRRFAVSEMKKIVREAAAEMEALREEEAERESSSSATKKRTSAKGKAKEAA